MLLRDLKAFRKECILSPLFKMLEASFELMIPLVVARIVDVGIAAGDRGYVVKMCLVMITLGIVGLVSSVTAQYYAAKAAVGYAARLRSRVMRHILGLSYSQMDTMGTSALVTRMTSDVGQVQNGINLFLRLFLRSPFVVFGAMIMAFTIDADAALVFVGMILVLGVIVFGIMLITMPMYRQVQNALDRVTAATRENLTGVRVLRAFRKEKEETEAFAEKTQLLTGKQISAGRISALMNPLTFVVVNLSIVLLIRIGAVKVDGGLLTQGMVIALYNYMSQILVELVKMANLIITVTKAVACGKRIRGVLDTASDDAAGTLKQEIQGNVAFQDVCARYEGAAENSLSNISFSAARGETVGIIGGTGAGKTTLVNLIPGFYPAVSGKVCLDGIPVEAYDREFLRRRIAVVPQKADLFAGTIRQNLLWGNPDASDEQLWEALEIAQARDFVEEKAGGLDGQVSQGGRNFSGGQRQRLTIARALVRRPAVLILDDSASALDFATDARLRSAIGNMPDGPTTFIVSQRAASVRYADRILVLDDGELAGMGDHSSLLQNCEVYREIFYSQFSEEVSAHV